MSRLPTARPAGGRRGGVVSCVAEAAEHRLTPTDQHLVLGSSGLWEVLGPQDAALRAHFYEKVGGRAGGVSVRHAAPPSISEYQPYH